jgi:hypothetical protein
MTDDNETQDDPLGEWRETRIYGTFLWAVPRNLDMTRIGDWPPEESRLLATVTSHVPDEANAKAEELREVREHFERKAEAAIGEQLVVGIAHGRHFSLFPWPPNLGDG